MHARVILQAQRQQWSLPCAEPRNKTTRQQARRQNKKTASRSLTFRAPDLSSRNASRTNSVLWGLSGSTSCAKTYPARARVASAAPTASLHPSAFAVTESTVRTSPLMKPLAFFPAPAAPLLLLPPLLPLPLTARVDAPLAPGGAAAAEATAAQAGFAASCEASGSAGTSCRKNGPVSPSRPCPPSPRPGPPVLLPLLVAVPVAVSALALLLPTPAPIAVGGGGTGGGGVVVIFMSSLVTRWPSALTEGGAGVDADAGAAFDSNGRGCFLFACCFCCFWFNRCCCCCCCCCCCRDRDRVLRVDGSGPPTDAAGVDVGVLSGVVVLPRTPAEYPLPPRSDGCDAAAAAAVVKVAEGSRCGWSGVVESGDGTAAPLGVVRCWEERAWALTRAWMRRSSASSLAFPCNSKMFEQQTAAGTNQVQHIHRTSYQVTRMTRNAGII